MNIIDKKPKEILRQEWIVISPERARMFLELNKVNRKLYDRTKVVQYSDDMANGVWRETGEAIKISRFGNLLDGQHRLRACIKAGVSFRTLIVYGLEEDTMQVMDSGKPRTVSDSLHLLGYKNATTTAAIANVLMDIRDGVKRTKARSRTHLTSFLNIHPDIEISAARVAHVRIGIPNAAIGSVHYAAASLLNCRPLAESFIDILQTGIPRNGKDDPVWLWRERVISLRMREGGRYRLSRELMVSGTFHAWNLHRRGALIKKFQIPDEAKIDGLTQAMLHEGPL